ncbi:MAG: hypothetical protein ABIP64_17060 [Burkholderiales bacterium]
MDLETVWYELSPYVYTISGVIALAVADARMGQLSGALLLVAALTIIRLRWVNRRNR